MASAYAFGHGKPAVDRHAIRRAQDCCAYFIPHLRPTYRVLDVGCGPGSLTTDIAALVPNGSIVGVDAGSAVVETANIRAKDIGLSNCSFQTADVMKLPFEDESFDVVYTHQVLIHLPDPVAAMKEMKRVCKKGGFVACREGTFDDFVFSPANPAAKLPRDTMGGMIREKGAEPDAGKYLAKWAVEAGVENGKVTESYSYLIQPSYKDTLRQKHFSEAAMRFGMVKDEGEWEEEVKVWEEWEDIEGSSWKNGCGEVVCWKS